MRKPALIRCSTLLLLILMLARPGMAQYNNAEIVGTVTDRQGSAIPGARVSAVHTESGIHTDRITDAAGRFSLPSLSVGKYTLTVSQTGFNQFIQKGLVLHVGQKVDLPVILEIGDLTESITVVLDNAGLLPTRTSEISDVIDNRKVEGLSNFGRIFSAGPSRQLQLALKLHF